MEHLNFRQGQGTEPASSVALMNFNVSDVSALLSTILLSTDQASIWSHVTGFFRDLGFQHILYGYSPDSRGPILGSPEDYLVLSTLPADVLNEMVAGGYYRMSATFNWALANAGIASWSMTAEDCGMGDEFIVTPEGQDFFRRNGLTSGCSIGFPLERTRGRGALALIAPPEVPQSDVDGLLAQTADMIFSVATVAHRRLSTMPYHPPGRRLTQRQREVLEWVGEGKTSADIAIIMGITVPTVEKHLRLARQTLGVETTAHALMRAAFLNQVFVAGPQGSAGPDSGSERDG